MLIATCTCCSISDTEPHYYADGEDAYDMRKELKPKSPLADSSAPIKAAKAGQKQQQGKGDTPKQARARRLPRLHLKRPRRVNRKPPPMQSRTRTAAMAAAATRGRVGLPRKGRDIKEETDQERWMMKAMTDFDAASPSWQ